MSFGEFITNKGFTEEEYEKLPFQKQLTLACTFVTTPPSQEGPSREGPSREGQLLTLVYETRAKVTNTVILALTLDPPWNKEKFEGIEWYDVRQDPAVKESDKTVGRVTDPHATLLIAPKEVEATLLDFQKAAANIVPLSRIQLKCSGVKVFLNHKSAEFVGSMAYGCVVMCLKPLRSDVVQLRQAALGCIPSTRSCFGGLEESEFIMHATVLPLFLF